MCTLKFNNQGDFHQIVFYFLSYSLGLQSPYVLPGLSVEELASLEGQERSNIEARIQWLRDIQTLLDGAMVLMHQYNQVAANSGSVYTHFNIHLYKA